MRRLFGEESRSAGSNASHGLLCERPTLKLAGVDLLLPAISLDLKGSSLQALRLGLLLEAFVGQYKAETVGEVLKRFKPAVDTDKVGLWFDTTTRLAGCAVWCEAKVAIKESLRQDQAVHGS